MSLNNFIYFIFFPSIDIFPLIIKGLL